MFRWLDWLSSFPCFQQNQLTAEWDPVSESVSVLPVMMKLVKSIMVSTSAAASEIGTKKCCVGRPEAKVRRECYWSGSTQPPKVYTVYSPASRYHQFDMYMSNRWRIYFAEYFAVAYIFLKVEMDAWLQGNRPVLINRHWFLFYTSLLDSLYTHLIRTIFTQNGWQLASHSTRLVYRNTTSSNKLN